LEPLPQFFPPTMISPGWTVAAKLGSRSSSACFAHSAGSRRVYVYLPGKITSVLTLSPYFQMRPERGWVVESGEWRVKALHIS
ncbi:MAG TPA: hypothetical protein PKU97_23765, partial [Kofleriaceae bacterium]|nr:hypothetical protein [Kofleriaceae bacterium]